MRVLFLNDVGFQFGAGTAHLRQIQSFLRAGHEVAAFCCYQGAEEERAAFTPEPPPGWLGLREFRELHWGKEPKPTDAQIIETLVRDARAFAPDLVVVGNLHAAQWPVALVGGLRDAGLPVVVFMHDGYYVSGRCAYAGDCRLYETGCDASCPTADEYPALARERIAGAWRERRQVLCGSSHVALAANSGWTLGLAARALPGIAHTGVVHYGLDERIFRPLDRALARRILGVPADAFVVLAGAVDLNDRRKGGHLLRHLIERMGARAHVLLFGFAPKEMDGVQSTGFLHDFRKMPLVYAAADVFVGTSLEEAFGQTLCEASACGIPVVALDAGGVPDIARHDVNARIVSVSAPDGLIDEVTWLMDHEDERRRLGGGGRALVEAEFTLERQGERWTQFLAAWPAVANS